MAKRKDLTKAAQDATRAMFGISAGVPEADNAEPTKPTKNTDTTKTTKGRKTKTAPLDGDTTQDAPEATEKPRRGRPRKNTESSGIKPDTALTDLLQERRKETEEWKTVKVQAVTKQPETKPKKTVVSRKVEFAEKTPTTPTSKNIEVTKTKPNRTKSNGDYIRLDMVKDGTNLKDYVNTMARVQGVSMTAYIQELILKDKKKNEGKTFTLTP